jgi:ketosteroid isomerase-like protein
MTDILDRWSAAEQANDAKGLDAVLAPDFVGVGPLGFVLDRQQWLTRFDNGLHNTRFTIANPVVHEHGSTTVVVAELDQQTTWQGSDNSGRYRITLVTVDDRLVSAHVGPLQRGGPPSRS